MQITIHGEEVFRAQKNQFAIGASDSGYQVAYSADGSTFTLDADAVVPAHETLVYLGAMQYCFYKLVGNTSNVIAQV